MRLATLSLTLSLLLSAATQEAVADPGKGKGPKPGANQGTSQSAGSQHEGTRAPWERAGVSRADWLLAKRLESINHMREIAQRNGNTRMLEQADKLEALARRQFLIHACGPKDHPCDPPASP